MDSLEFLARNANFKEEWRFAVQAPSGSVIYPSDNETTVFQGCYSRVKIQAKRDELTNKPMLKDIPEGMACIVQDLYGNWYGCTTDQVWASREHISWRIDQGAEDGNKFKLICCGSLIGDWRETLELVNRDFNPKEFSKGVASEKLKNEDPIINATLNAKFDPVSGDGSENKFIELDGDKYNISKNDLRDYAASRVGYWREAESLVSLINNGFNFADSLWIPRAEIKKVLLDACSFKGVSAVESISKTRRKALMLWRTINHAETLSDEAILMSKRFKDYEGAIKSGYDIHLTCDPIGYED